MGFGRKNKPKHDPLKQFRVTETIHDKSSHESVFKHETEAASLVGGRRHRGSGAITGHRSDGSSERYQIEAKQTQHQSLSVSLGWLTKLSMEAVGKSKIPLLHVRFLNAPVDVDNDWIMVSQREFKTLFDIARGNDETLGRWAE